MKKLMCLIGAVAAAGSLLAAEEISEVETKKAPGKMMLRIASVETPDTRSEKSWTPPRIPAAAKKLPWSEADIQKANPKDALKMKRENSVQEELNAAAAREVAIANYNDSVEFMRGVREKLQNTTFGRQVMQAIDKFAGYASQEFNSDCIEFFHQLDAIDGKDFAKFTTGHGPAVHVDQYFIKMIFDDPASKTATQQIGGDELSRTFFTQKVTYQVLDHGGKVVDGNVITKKSSEVDASKDEVAEQRVELLEACLREIAKGINDKFVATMTFGVVSTVKNDEEFNADAATLAVDGVERSFGEKVGLMKADTHVVEVSLDGYKQKGGKEMKFSSSGTKKLQMAPTTCKLTVNVKGPAGFDASSATIELVGADGASESLTSGEESTVQQGKWTLKVSADGYSAKPKALNLTSNKKVENITVVKEAAPAAGANAQ